MTKLHDLTVLVFSDRLPGGVTVWQQAATESAVIQAAVVERPGQAERGGGCRQCTQDSSGAR